MKKFIEAVKFDAKGLVPVVVQDYKSKKVLMLAYMNKESLKLSFETKQATYFSRSRQRLWKKGETSGNVQNILKMNLDCDGDTILLEVEQIGVACHTGTPTCFSKSIILNNSEEDTFSLEILYNTIEERKRDPKVGSYTNYLFEKGIDKILKKVGEECAEVIIASKNSDISELQYELSDLVYHCIVLMVEKGLTLEAIQEELKKRMK